MQISHMTGGDALADSLLRHGIDTVFGLPGAQLYGLFDALHRTNIRVIGARHEQGSGYMAFGYARSTGRPAVYSVVPGPGVLNAGAAALTSLGCNAPVLCLTGQTPTNFLGQGHGHLHEMPDQLGTLRSIFKWAQRVEHPSAAPELVSQAFQQMLSGRMGPAALEMPWDTFVTRAAVRGCEPLAVLPPPPVDIDVVERAAMLIRESRNPMIFVGGGAFGACDEIRELAERIQAPVVAHRSGRGVVSNAHPLGLTLASAYKLWPETDLVIGIGSRMEVPRWRWSWKPENLKTLRIDIDPVEMRRARPDVGIVADAREASLELLRALVRLDCRRSDRMDRIQAATDKAYAEIQEIQPQMAYLNVLREVLPANAIVTDELSQVGFTSWFGFPIYEPRTFISSGYQGNLGSGYPTALGVKVAHPDRPVVAICGDGGFMFGVQELSTAVQYGIDVIALVFNNNAYGNVRRDQIEGFAGRTIGSDLTNPDFAKLAHAFGANGLQVETPEAFRRAMDKALNSGGSWVIEIKVDKDSEVSPWRFLAPPPPPAAAR